MQPVLDIDTTVFGTEAVINEYLLSLTVNLVDFDYQVLDFSFTVEVVLNCPTDTDGDMNRLSPFSIAQPQQLSFSYDVTSLQTYQSDPITTM